MSGTRKHGQTDTPTFRAWRDMLTRCYNPNVRGFSSWGGRGISVCDRWRWSFESFLADMGEKPPKWTLERLDNNGNYEPGNCKWATRTEQNRNTRKTLFITHRGTRKSLREWSEITGINHATLERRVHAGYSEEEIFRPLHHGKKGGVYA